MFWVYIGVPVVYGNYHILQSWKLYRCGVGPPELPCLGFAVSSTELVQQGEATADCKVSALLPGRLLPHYLDVSINKKRTPL